LGESIWLTAAIWMALALVASIISIRVGVSVALIEIAVGVAGGNLLGLHSNDWSMFWLPSARCCLPFWPERKSTRPRYAAISSPVWLGFVSFLLPFLAAWAFTYYVIG
jgi:hypothetical protein